MDIDSKIQTEHIKIPNMILQPYIENAIWHGLSHKQGEKKLHIHVAQQNGTTIYEIEDNGVGRQKAAELKSQYRKEHKSRGMELLTKRFKLLQKEYGAQINTTVSDVMTDNQVTGTKVSIQVPTFLPEALASL
jgi:LytS/YehU family sensor histidine kinase